MKDKNDWIHDVLDGGSAHEGQFPPQSPEAERLAAYQEAMRFLSETRQSAPAGFAEQVIASLPEAPNSYWSEKLLTFFHPRRMGALPVLAGVLAVIVFALLLEQTYKMDRMDGVPVTFEVYAPKAHRVELVGSFNDWKPGEIMLKGPDAAGHWTVTVQLPHGRHEYLFLVDGKKWITDPLAAIYRPDGFGRQNALIEL
jgi:hypothetical protein